MPERVASVFFIYSPRRERAARPEGTILWIISLKTLNF